MKDKKVIFKDFTCSIEINKTNVISGPSGSGKTTLVDLICGFYEPLKGKIFLDNLELNKDNFFQFQNEISYVSQDLYLNDKNIIFDDISTKFVGASSTEFFLTSNEETVVGVYTNTFKCFFKKFNFIILFEYLITFFNSINI